MLTNNEEKMLGYLIYHPNCKFPELCCMGLHLSVVETNELLQGLISKGLVKGMGYASHVEEYFVPDTKSFKSPENIGRLFYQWIKK